jgi:hypothetical protein
MKKILLMAAVSLLATVSFSQNEKYTKAMQEKVAAFDTTRSVDGLKSLANTFERIALAEKNQWLPYYYAALANVNMGYNLTAGKMGGMTETLDPIADKADEMITKAAELSKDNSEIYVIMKMVASLRMMGDPMNRFMTYGPIAQDALLQARKLNPENPRTYLLEAQDKYFTPEQYGGSKEEAKKLFNEALKKFDTFQPESPLHPYWGKAMTQYFLSQYK